MSDGSNCYILLRKKHGQKSSKALSTSLKSNFESSKTDNTEVLAGSLLRFIEKITTLEYELETLNEALDGEISTSVRVICHGEGDFERISIEVLNLLRPIPTCRERLEVYSDQSWLNDGKKLQVGENVYVKLKGELSEIQGIIRYKGSDLPGSKGILFGIQLEESKGTCDGKYRDIRCFYTKSDHAVFVALHKVRRHKYGWQMKARMRADMDGIEDFPRHAKSNVTQKVPLSVGERIVWMSDTGAEKGVVKWIGCLPGDLSSNITVGVEFDKKVGSGTGKYKDERLFFAKQGHASLIPVMGLMKESEFEGAADNRLFVDMSNPLSPSVSNAVPHEMDSRLTEFNFPESKHANYGGRGDSTGKLMGLGVVGASSAGQINQINRLTELEMQDYLLAQQFSQMSTVAGSGVAASSGTNPLYEHARMQEKYLGTPLQGVSTSQALTKPLSPALMSQGVRVASQTPDPDLEVGSLVQVQLKAPLYGTIRWIGYIDDQAEKKTAGLEMEEELSAGTDGVYRGVRYFVCPPKKGFFVPLYRCSKDKRYNFTTSPNTSNDFGDQMTPDIPGDVAPPEVLTQGSFNAICGKNRGIQGHHNSCYLDATLFCMFYFSTVFDNIFNRPANELDLPEYPEVQRVLKEGIVNPLRKFNYVRADKVLRLRELLDKLGTVPGMMGEEKDPEEFLNALLTQIMKADSILQLSTGQNAYFYQLFIEEDEKLLLPTTQKLVELSFLQGNVKLKEVPPCLMLQMPRFGKDYKMFHRIVPSLELDITDIVENCPRDCIVCGGLATFECKNCYQVNGPGLNTTAFCESCMRTSHKHKSRSNHQPERITISKEFLEEYECRRARMLQHQGVQDGDEPDNVPVKREIMELFAVICIQTSHYVSFVKCGFGPDAPWVFFDSMADRMGEQGGYNIPEVTPIPMFSEWLHKNNLRELHAKPDDKDLPEHLRRVLCDGYMCMYQSTSVMMYY